MIKISLHGILDVFEKPVELSVSTAREATTAIISHLRRTNPDMFEQTLFFQIRGYDTIESLDVPLQDGDHLHFMPAFNAGKKAGVFQIIVGAVLVIGGMFLGVPPNVSMALISAGLSLAVGGVLQLLTPVPRIDTQPEETNPEASKYISGTGNTTKIGTRIPLAYGTFPIYGHFLSINVQSRDISTGAYGGTPVTPYGPNYRFGYPIGGSINAF